VISRPGAVNRRRVVVACSVALVALLVVGVVTVAGGGRQHATAFRSTPSDSPGVTQPPVPPPSARSRWVPVPPVTDNPPRRPVQDQYDRALAQGLSSSGTVLAAETAQVPAPALSATWPAPAVSYQPDTWVRAFTDGLLRVDFARQSRTGLGGWLSAEEAPELLPGIPPSAQDKVLYLSLFDPTAAGGTSTPVPSPAQWQANASAGVSWSVSGLLVEPDARWSQIIADGWQPVDQRFSVNDVSGDLTAHQGSTTVDHRFSMVVYTGSARWHDGYGTTLVADWTES
jgi:hypothetical protein